MSKITEEKLGVSSEKVCVVNDDDSIDYPGLLLLFLVLPAGSQLVIDGCALQAYTKCPEVSLSNAYLNEAD